ncbi:MAG: hypothetical protein ONB46_10350 [candidate division KSB1 bacterium]|nr:hypothetical protein [candidate division KSB1 bacterium]MDZ7366205.1 hypothetical protein [candidate division KSB1 bacterium]MDZ7404423.1 hypothetical protein [candidate division KSB1 bacterium]
MFQTSTGVNKIFRPTKQAKKHKNDFVSRIENGRYQYNREMAGTQAFCENSGRWCRVICGHREISPEGQARRGKDKTVKGDALETKRIKTAGKCILSFGCWNMR